MHANGPLPQAADSPAQSLFWSALHSGKHDGEVEPIAFDVLALDGDDIFRPRCASSSDSQSTVGERTTWSRPGGSLRPFRRPAGTVQTLRCFSHLGLECAP